MSSPRVVQSASCLVRELAIRELAYPQVVQLPIPAGPHFTICQNQYWYQISAILFNSNVIKPDAVWMIWEGCDTVDTTTGLFRKAMGTMRNCGMWNAEGKMQNGMCSAMVIGRDVTPRDHRYSAFHRMPCIDSVEVKCILSMQKIALCSVHATFRCWFLDNADEC